MGCFESLRGGRQRVSAEPRERPHRDDWHAGLLGGRCDQGLRSQPGLPGLNSDSKPCVSLEIPSSLCVLRMLPKLYPSSPSAALATYAIWHVAQGSLGA